MDSLPDVLDHMGRTPREFGAAHLHFERVLSDGFRGIARVLVQGAFDPMPAGGTLKFFASNDEFFEIRELASVPMPALPRGSVVRLIVPLLGFAEGPPVTRVLLKPSLPEPGPKAERIRQAWKLHDTIESPKLSDLAPSTVDGMNVNVGASLVATAMMGGAGFAISYSGSTGMSPTAPGFNTKRYAAMKLPDGLLASVETADVAELPAVQTETIWSLGAPLPEAAPLVVAKPQVVDANARRRCAACGFSGKLSEYERDRNCPQCGDYWM